MKISERARRDPWARDLIIDQVVANDYYQLFLAADPEYQDDAKWYEWLVAADRASEQRQREADGTDEGTGPDVIRPPGPTPQPRTEQEQLRDAGQLDEDLTGPYGFHPSREVNVIVYKTSLQMWIEEGGVRNQVPVKCFRELDGTVECFYDVQHPRLNEDDSDLSDLIITEVSLIIRDMYYQRYPLSYVFGPVRAARLYGSHTGSIEGQAQRLLEDLVPLVTDAYAVEDMPNIGELRSLLTENELADVRRAVAESGGDEERLETILNSGDFLPSMPMVLGRIIRRHPERFLDNRLFSLPYENVPALLPDVERVQIGMANAERVANSIEDLASVLSAPAYESAELRRIGRRRALGSHDLIRALLVTP